MSNMTIPSEARGWVASWRKHYERKARGSAVNRAFYQKALAERLRQAATEQRANLTRAKRARFHESGDYETSVVYLEEEAARAEDAVYAYRAAAWMFKAKDAGVWLIEACASPIDRDDELEEAGRCKGVYELRLVFALTGLLRWVQGGTK